jgi:hypothetical protein
MEQRESLRRIDDEDTKCKIATARDIIYKKNYAVDTESVESILKEQSLVPTLVSPISVGSPKQISDVPFRTHFRQGLVRMDLTYS